MKNLTILSLFKIAFKHILVLMLVAVIFAAAAFSYCKFIATPKYSATGSILVTNGAILYTNTQSSGSSVDNADIMASMNFSSTVVDILKTNGIYKQLSDSINNKETYTDLKACAEVKKRDELSLFIDITFTSNNKEEAVELVNKFLKIAPEYINSFVPGCASTVSIADDSKKVSPNTVTVTFFAGVLGAALTFAIILLIYSLNTVILNESDFKERFDIPVIGTIPDFSKAKTDKSYGSYGEFIRKGIRKDG